MNLPDVIFTNVAGTEGASIRSFLSRERMPYATRGYWPANLQRASMPKKSWDSRRKIAVVRDPVERFIATFKAMQRKGTISYNMSIEECIGCLEPGGNIQKLFRRGRRALMNPIKPQYIYTCDPFGQVIVNDLVLFEDMPVFFSELLKEYTGREVAFPALKEPSGEEPIVTDDAIRRIQKVYELDYQLLNMEKK